MLQIDNKEDCENAFFKGYKQSDKRQLSTDAKVIVALLRNQPLKRLSLIKNAGIDPSSFSRMKRLLENRGIIREVDNGYALWNYVEPKSSWGRLLHDFEQVGVNRLKICIEKASYAGRDLETGWRHFNYYSKSSIEGIIVPKNAPRLVAVARSEGIYFHNEYDGVVLTADSIGYKDRLSLSDKLYEVRDVEERLDSYELVGYRIAKVVEVIPSEEEEKTGKSTSSTLITVRNKIREFLKSHINDSNIVRDFTKASYCIIYSNPNYPIIKEFLSSTDPVDGLYTIGIPQTKPLFSADQSIYGYKEHVPIFVYTIDKDRVAGSKLQELMESELRRVCETYRVEGNWQGYLERCGDRKERIGSTFLYSTEFVFNFRRSRE